MSSRLPKHLHDAVTAARLASGFCAVPSADALRENLLVRSAVERQLEILGEACKRAVELDDGLRQRVPDCVVAIGFRNRLIHGYDKVDHAIVFETVTRDLPVLVAQLELELTRQPEPGS